MIAATRSANTIANPALLPTCKINSTGSRETIAERYGAARHEHADKVPNSRPHNSDVRLERMGVNHRRHGVRGVVESIDEFKPQRHQKRQSQKEERKECSVEWISREIGQQAPSMHK